MDPKHVLAWEGKKKNTGQKADKKKNLVTQGNPEEIFWYWLH